MSTRAIGRSVSAGFVAFGALAAFSYTASASTTASSHPTTATITLARDSIICDEESCDVNGKKQDDTFTQARRDKLHEIDRHPPTTGNR